MGLVGTGSLDVPDEHFHGSCVPPGRATRVMVLAMKAAVSYSWSCRTRVWFFQQPQLRMAFTACSAALSPLRAYGRGKQDCVMLWCLWTCLWLSPSPELDLQGIGCGYSSGNLLHKHEGQ